MGGLILVVGSLAIAAAAVAGLVLASGRTRRPVAKAKQLSDSLDEAAKVDVEHIFNEDFREELRNRGRLHFEKIIGENAMFLQQDLRLTTSQLNDYMKQEISK